MNILLYQACREGRLEFVKSFTGDPSLDNNLAIRRASEYGHLEIVKFLLENEKVDPSDGNNYALQMACRNGHTKVVELLLKDGRVNPADMRNYALKIASQYGHLEIVKLLLETEPLDFYNESLRNAAEYGHLEIVKLLSTKFNPSFPENLALKDAYLNKHFDVVKFLLNDRRVQEWGIPYNIRSDLAQQLDEVLVVRSRSFQNQTNIPRDLIGVIVDFISINDIKIPDKIKNKTT